MSVSPMPDLEAPLPRPTLEEAAPSELRATEPTAARWFGTVGGACLFVGALAYYLNTPETPRLIGPGFASVLMVLGVCGLLVHAARETDTLLRRAYAALGFALIAGGVVAAFVPNSSTGGTYLFPLGLSALGLGLAFLLPVPRSEPTGSPWAFGAVAVPLFVGALLALTGLIGGSTNAAFLIYPGSVVALVGLVFLTAGIGLAGGDSPLAFRVGQAMGVAGFLVAAVALVRSILPLLAKQFPSLSAAPYFVPSGLILIAAGLLYLLVAVGVCSERPLVVMTKRELGAFFLSPVAYIVLLGMTLVGAVSFFLFTTDLYGQLREGQPMTEPIVLNFVITFIPVFCVIFVVPAITMRLLSEEQRTGTMEVLLTAPVNEAAVVLSKFFAALAFFLVVWLPWALMLVVLRVEGGEPFDAVPLLGFAVVLVSSGAAFVGMGLFFSALTRNQIVAAVLTFMGMMGLFAAYMLGRAVTSETLRLLFRQIDFVTLWIDTLGGKLAVRGVVVQLSQAVVWLFLTIKLLEARRWR